MSHKPKSKYPPNSVGATIGTVGDQVSERPFTQTVGGEVVRAVRSKPKK